MKKEIIEHTGNMNDVAEANPEGRGDLKKTEQEIMDEAKSFFQEFCQKFRKKEVEDPREKEEKDFLEDVRDLDVNTAPTNELLRRAEGTDSSNAESQKGYGVESMPLTKEELQQMDENDPGYVNDKVLDYENDLNTGSNHYQETGLHTGSIRWGEYATKEGREYELLPEGKILSRWGDEQGTFLSDVDTAYSDLELPVIEDKNSRSFYEVQKQFPAEISKIAKQPWNKVDDVGEREEQQEVAIQYKMPIPIQDLINEGYLKRLEFNEKSELI